MSTTLAKWLSAIIAITVMFTPILAYLDSLHRAAVEEVLHEYSKRAAVEGYFTDEMIDDMKDTLSTRYNFDENEIEIVATNTRVYRPSPHDSLENHMIEAEIKVPSTPIFIFDLFNSDLEISKDIRVISEYIGT
ncbi:hypothetical protein [Desertibacillus haloalkaliphilus]|uniref:hypothetical protein n=1 Tax=Desertibacillus haloalkaliphilus TaxID=1328930 RepID=UPI001C2813B9|nr:hypothetical protein [Desertibacillus haloalkaliphilus]MBU8908053.1 hypothetical protein [Desertibacillus haloalkaliphilus]